MTTLASTLGLTLIVVAPVAAPRLAPQPPSVEPEIYGGGAVEACGWPTTVYMGGCTGILVHPEVVVFAAHCMYFGGGLVPEFAEFGEAIDPPARRAATSSCTMAPGWTDDPSAYGDDVAFCMLAEPVLDVPPVPILMGCETAVLEPGRDVTLVGYGFTELGLFGVKHEVQAELNRFEGPEVSVGGPGVGSCRGDSGGPAYVQLDDGSWRVFGISSRGTTRDCSGASIYGLIHRHVAWIEAQTGVDITPCHDADGTWSPGPVCTGFAQDPGRGGAGWAEGCAEAELSGPSDACGAPFEPDDAQSGTGSDDAGPGDPGSLDDGTGLVSAGASTEGGSSPSDDEPPGACTCRARRGIRSDPDLAWLLLALGLARVRRSSVPKGRADRPGSPPPSR